MNQVIVEHLSLYIALPKYLDAQQEKIHDIYIRFAVDIDNLQLLSFIGTNKTNLLIFVP